MSFSISDGTPGKRGTSRRRKAPVDRRETTRNEPKNRTEVRRRSELNPRCGAARTLSARNPGGRLTTAFPTTADAIRRVVDMVAKYKSQSHDGLEEEKRPAREIAGRIMTSRLRQAGQFLVSPRRDGPCGRRTYCKDSVPEARLKLVRELDGPANWVAPAPSKGRSVPDEDETRVGRAEEAQFLVKALRAGCRGSGTVLTGHGGSPLNARLRRPHRQRDDREAEVPDNGAKIVKQTPRTGFDGPHGFIEVEDADIGQPIAGGRRARRFRHATQTPSTWELFLRIAPRALLKAPHRRRLQLRCYEIKPAISANEGISQRHQPRVHDLDVLTKGLWPTLRSLIGTKPEDIFKRPSPGGCMGRGGRSRYPRTENLLRRGLRNATR